MAANQGNIEIVIPPRDIIHPSCPHGPAILFEQFDQATKTVRQFFACSAFRDKSKCSFHQWVDEKHDKPSHESNTFSHKKHRLRYRKFRALAKTKRYVCCTCGLLLLPSEIHHHNKQGHAIKGSVQLKDLRKPSYLFAPLDDNKTFAQYLFSPKTVEFLLKSVEHLGYSHVLCVGTPRIHEEIQLRRKHGDTFLSSMLLDLDERYAQLYSPALFAKYNMFNHHFFEKKGKKQAKKFLATGLKGTVLITDPPFGGMVEALAQSFAKISQTWQDMCKELPLEQESLLVKDVSIPMMWIFPYFMENKVLTHMPSLTMLDYKVDYDNHNLFNNHHKKKRSPVRIFTNITPADFHLPEEEGYWFCKLCQRYSSEENQHCKDCGTCPSKDGTSYVHCDACLRCVKPSRFHCFKCGFCVLKDHQCGKILSSGCYICGEAGHKRRECPQRHTSLTANKLQKRKKISQPGPNRKKRRKE
ncbi:Zinc finger cchc domain-containing protein 4 [Plakobranchus ocellatus]|uniref:Zinc finger cchc domain-containing protein 4 n=1 Tax=Plakobranchus ocellatus TaxID=259542 RepID=A0AAV4DZS8_9GAST|nr:Zinc finger cchc domain-containing protein 4 [Plakobranchus ocellatus]